MSRPLISTTLLPPGGISDVRAMMCRAMLSRLRSELVDCARVGVEDLPALGFRQRRPEGEPRIVEIPMRIVRREQQAVDADPFDQRTQMFCFVRLVDRLRREPEMLLHIFRRLSLEMRHLTAERFEVPVHPPGRRRNPAEAAFDEDDLQLREALRDAFENEAG